MDMPATGGRYVRDPATGVLMPAPDETEAPIALPVDVTTGPQLPVLPADATDPRPADETRKR